MAAVLRWCVPAGYGAVRGLRKVVLVVAILVGGHAHAEEVTIAALGDSLTQGYGLPNGQGFVPQLEVWLAGQGVDAAIINAGVSGDTTAGGLARVDWTLTPEVDALIVALGGNDLLRGLDPAQSRANLDGILRAARDRQVPVLLVGMEAPPNYGADFKAEFDGMYPDLARVHDALLHPNFLAALTAEVSLQTAITRYMQSDGIHPNADGVVLVVEDVGPLVLDLIGQVTD